MIYKENEILFEDEEQDLELVNNFLKMSVKLDEMEKLHQEAKTLKDKAWIGLKERMLRDEEELPYSMKWDRESRKILVSKDKKSDEAKISEALRSLFGA